jgi:hypothetical protein
MATATSGYDEAKRELDKQQKRLVELDAVEAEAAAAGRAAFAKWREERDDVYVEVQLMTKVVSLEEVHAEEEARIELEELLVDRNAKNMVLANRFKVEGTKLVTGLLGLLRELAEASEEDMPASLRLRPIGAHVVSADVLARAIPAKPRVDVRETAAELWADAHTGKRIEHQQAVRETEDGFGVTGFHDILCVKRKFRIIDYLDEVGPGRVEAFVTSLRLPNCDRPGFAWNGDTLSHPASALATLDQPKSESTRESKTDYVAVDPHWVTPTNAGPQKHYVGRRFGL